MGQSVFEQRILRDDILLIRPGQSLDNTNAHLMVDAISTAQSNGYRYIIIDMDGLEFLSSAGVGSILGTIEGSREVGGDIILCNVGTNVMHVLQVLDLDEYMTIRVDEREATATCGVSD